MPLERFGKRHLVLIALPWLTALALILYNAHLYGGQTTMTVHFVPRERFALYDSDYVPCGYGSWRVYWDSDREMIYWAQILISSTEVTQQERSRVIWEALTRCLGLLDETCTYPESIFCPESSEMTGYTAIDRTAIEMLYQENVRFGMSEDQLWTILKEEYTQEEIAFFCEIALGAEWGDPEQVIHKWTRDVTIEVRGSPTEADLAAIHEIVSEINALTSDIQLSVDEQR